MKLSLEFFIALNIGLAVCNAMFSATALANDMGGPALFHGAATLIHVLLAETAGNYKKKKYPTE